MAWKDTETSLEGPGTCHNSSAPSWASRAQIWQKSDVYSDCHSECSELPQWNTRCVRNLTDSNSSVFEDKWFHSIHIFKCSYQWMSQTFSTFSTVRLPCYYTTNKSLYSLHCLLSSRATVNTLKIYVAFKAKFNADMLLFHFRHLLKHENHKWNKTVLYLTRH